MSAPKVGSTKLTGFVCAEVLRPMLAVPITIYRYEPVIRS